MKKLFFAILFFISFASSAQLLTVTTNPAVIDPTVTSVSTVTISRGLFREIVFITIPATNAGTVKINTISSDMTYSPTYAAGVERTIILTVREKIYIQFSNAADFAWIHW